MIYKTIKDLVFFVCFILIFLLAFSIASWSLLTTNKQVSWNYNDDGSLSNVTVSGRGSGLWSWQLLRSVGDYGVWKIFGQVELINEMDAYSNVAFVLNVLFVATTNVLLLNVLIALFNVSIRNVQQQSHRIWRYQRYLLIDEYSNKPLLVPPFNTIYYLYCLIRYFIKKMQQYGSHQSNNAPNASTTESRLLNAAQKQFKINNAIRRESAIAADHWNEVLKQKKKNDQTKVTVNNTEQK